MHQALFRRLTPSSTSTPLLFSHCPLPRFPLNPSLPKQTVGVGSIYYLMRRDVRQGAAQLRRNAKTIKGWIEEAEVKAKDGVVEAGKPPPQKQVPPSSSSSSSAPSKAE